MAEVVTDKDVERARARVEKLRDQKADLESQISAAASSSANEYRIATLDNEAALLEAQVAQLKELAKPKTQSTVTDALVDQVDAGAPVPPDPSAVLPDREK